MNQNAKLLQMLQERSSTYQKLLGASTCHGRDTLTEIGKFIAEQTALVISLTGNLDRMVELHAKSHQQALRSLQMAEEYEALAEKLAGLVEKANERTVRSLALVERYKQLAEAK